jgi:hypothetical protein
MRITELLTMDLSLDWLWESLTEFLKTVAHY